MIFFIIFSVNQHNSKYYNEASHTLAIGYVEWLRKVKESVRLSAAILHHPAAERKQSKVNSCISILLCSHDIR